MISAEIIGDIRRDHGRYTPRSHCRWAFTSETGVRDPRHELMPNFTSNSYVSIMSRAHATSQVLQGHVKQILGLDFSPNGVNLASGSDDHTVRHNNSSSSNIESIATTPAAEQQRQQQQRTPLHHTNPSAHA